MSNGSRISLAAGSDLAHVEHSADHRADARLIVDQPDIFTLAVVYEPAEYSPARISESEDRVEGVRNSG